MSRRPASARRSISSQLGRRSDTVCFSFCSPSRGPTSTMRTRSAVVAVLMRPRSPLPLPPRSRPARRRRRPARPARSGRPGPLPSRGALMVCSIFIASSTSSASPFFTAAPAATSSAITLPGIGAFSPPSASSPAPPTCSVSISASGQARPSKKTCRRSPLIDHRGVDAALAELRMQLAVRPGRAAREDALRAEAEFMAAGAASTVDRLHRVAVAQRDRARGAAVEPPAVERAPRRVAVGRPAAALRAARWPARCSSASVASSQTSSGTSPGCGNSSACSRSISAGVEVGVGERRHRSPAGPGTRRCWPRPTTAVLAPAPGACAPAPARGRASQTISLAIIGS